MPEIMHFIVKEEREVRVAANSAVDAARIAEAAFSNGQNSNGGVIDGPEGIWGNTRSRVKTTSIMVLED